MDEDSSNASNPCCEDVNEFQKYLADQNFTKDENALQFWQAKQIAYPNLSVLAKKILAVPATSISAPIESFQPCWKHTAS